MNRKLCIYTKCFIEKHDNFELKKCNDLKRINSITALKKLQKVSLTIYESRHCGICCRIGKYLHVNLVKSDKYLVEY